MILLPHSFASYKEKAAESKLASPSGILASDLAAGETFVPVGLFA